MPPSEGASQIKNVPRRIRQTNGTNGCSVPRSACADFAPARLASLRTRSSRLVKGADAPAFRWKSALPLRYFLRSSIRSTSETLRFPSPTSNRSEGEHTDIIRTDPNNSAGLIAPNSTA